MGVKYRLDLVRAAELACYCMSRKEIIKLNNELKLVEGEKLTYPELALAYLKANDGRSCLFPELTPELNEPIHLEKSKEFWGKNLFKEILKEKENVRSLLKETGHL